ncbi:MAG: ComF family protein [Clostridium sp.]|nr:ComF family protein [Clostridium sp.]
MIYNQIRLAWDSVCDFIFPRTCLTCGRRLALSEKHVCACCLLKLPYVHTRTYEDNIVTRSFWGFLPVEKGTSMFYYHRDSAYRFILHALKYQDMPEVAYDMGIYWSNQIAHKGFFDGVDLLVPLPLSARRKRQRGYNQSEYIARGVSAITGIPVETKAIIRAIATPTQTHLSKLERHNNVRNIFRIVHPESLTGKHILLIDDVLTTGASLISCGQAIRSACPGIRISIFTLAKTMNL